jgi:hypothetical protein
MAIIQALIALITKSAGKILNAIFGWAVHALFGKTTARDQTILSALVAAAVAWPLLAAGVVAPKIAALVLAFVPLPKSVPSWIVRLVWLGLALAVPIALGLTIAARRPPQVREESVIKRVLRGFPLTLGLALAFLIMFVSVPILRLVALVRRLKSADIPLVTDTDSYHEVAARVVEALNRHGFALQPADPGWWIKAPTRVLGFFGGKAFAGFVPLTLEHYVGGGVEISFYTSGVLLRGKGGRATWAHGLIVETAVHSRGLQTFAAAAQEIEREIRRVWKDFDQTPPAARRSDEALTRIDALAHRLATVDVDYEEWQVLYRQLLQVERAVRGQRQLLDDATGAAPAAASTPSKETAMGQDKAPPPPARDITLRGLVAPRVTGLGQLPTPALLGELTKQVEALVTTQIALAKSELAADLKTEARTVAGLSISALAAFITVNLLLVTAALALSAVLPPWGAGLTVTAMTAVVAVTAGAVAWRTRVRRPLARTRHALEEDIKWTKRHPA